MLRVVAFLIFGPTPSAKFFPDPWADPKRRSSLGFYTLHHGTIRAHNWGIYFLDPPVGRGLGGKVCANPDQIPDEAGAFLDLHS